MTSSKRTPRLAPGLGIALLALLWLAPSVARADDSRPARGQLEAGIPDDDNSPRSLPTRATQHDPRTANPCNPCAGKNPCNPCGANPCNPCAGKNPCNPCAANPCTGNNPCNPCAAGRVDASRFKQPAGASLASGDRAELVALGEKLWQDRSLGETGLACATCHVDRYGQMNASFASPYPHFVAMPHQQAGVDQVSAAEMVNFCMIVPMGDEPLPWDSRELAALAGYVEHIQPGFVRGAAGAANPCNPCNPCAGRNPCNPCAGKNPCNPCGANPCNPCAGANPCGGS